MRSLTWWALSTVRQVDESWSERLENAYRNGQMVGWNFSRLDGRMTAETPSWDFDALCLTALSQAASALDVGRFGGQPAYPDATLEHDAAASAGLILGDQNEWCGRMRFRDAETLVEYMALVPWDVPGFTVGAQLSTLADLDREPSIDVTQRRYWFTAHQPR